MTDPYDKLDSELSRLKADMAQASADDLLNMLHEVRTTLKSDASADDKVRWLRTFLRC